MPDREHASDIQRFGFNQPAPARKILPASLIQKAISRFQAMPGAGARVRALPSGAVSGVSGTLSSPQSGPPESVAASFLRQNQDILLIDPSSLQLGLKKQVSGLTHLLYQQTLNGLPVEFSRVKVHLSGKGEVLGVDSGYIPNLNISPVPSVSQGQAAAAVAAEAGRTPPLNGTLVYLPIYGTGDVRLAWKFHFAANHAIWNYYVDARTGQVLFRYNDLTFATSGTAWGYVYDIDPNRGSQVLHGMQHENVYVYGAAGATQTDATGAFSTATNGKIVSGLQGSYVNVAHANLPSVHYDNGSGVWCTAATPVSSPNPYSGGTASPNSSVFAATVNSPASASLPSPCTGGTVVKLLPHFSSFQVGVFDPNSGISQNDQVRIYDVTGSTVASYIGSKGAFTGAAVMGASPSYQLSLVSAPGDSGPGFTVDISSALVLTSSPGTAQSPDSSFVWSSTMTSDGGLDEINVYYHVNKMHDYFTGGVDSTGAADISHPFPAMVRLGPNYANAFFDPDQNSISFGDILNGAFALDATVIHHEYTHYVVNKIYPVYNFGQDGAISEAIADYFSASSLNDASIGAFVSGNFGSEGSVRNLDCTSNASLCQIFPTNWTGEIHHDGLMLSQALWEIRRATPAGCGDQLAFQSLFFFPGSYQEFLDAMLQVDRRGLAAACGGSVQSTITAKFSNHGINIAVASGADGYEPNDGAQLATNVSTFPAVSANIYPAGDVDYYTFGAGAGPLHLTLSLPPHPTVAGAYLAYGLTLFDRQLRILGQVFPTIDNGTLSGNCNNASTPDQMCRTLAPAVQLSYNNSGPMQFYVAVTAAPTDDGSNSNANSTALYTLRLSYVQPSALSASIVSASFDHDTINFAVNVATFTSVQNSSFTYAQLRDQALAPIPQTATNGASPYMVLVSSSGASGNITGALRLVPGFASRFPSVGTVYVEVFGYNALQYANTGGGSYAAIPQSLGVSNAINITASGNDFKAYNNILRPALGQKATFKFSLTSAGHVTLKLYTISGVQIATLVDGDFPAGSGSVDWYGANFAGTTVASGIYLANLDAPGFSKVQKVVVVK